jgi:protein involved in sex pheromone biosynthesis
MSKHQRGSYRYGYAFLTSLIERDKSILSDKKSPYALQNILGKDKTNWNTKVNGISLDYTLNSVTEDSLMLIFGAFAKLGDKQILSNKKSPYYLKGILGKDKTNQTIKVNGISLDYTLNSVTDFSIFPRCHWGFLLLS